MDNSQEIDVAVLTKRLREEGMEAIVGVYKMYRNDFLAFGKRLGASREILLSGWHDAVIAFYEIALQGQYDPKRSSLKTYLFTIAKYKVINELKKEKKELEFEERDFPFAPVLPFLIKEKEDKKEKLVKEALNKLGEKCRQILVLTYYHQYAAEAIQHRMGYENSNVVYSHKSRCLKKLREMMTQK